jgi:hypothetical protein
MPDGTVRSRVTPFTKKEQLQNEQLDEVSDCIGKAIALSDVLTMMANDCDVESLHKGSLSTALQMLFAVLLEAEEGLHTAMGVGASGQAVAA